MCVCLCLCCVCVCVCVSCRVVSMMPSTNGGGGGGIQIAARRQIWIAKSATPVNEAWSGQDADQSGVLTRDEFKGSFVPPRASVVRTRCLMRRAVCNDADRRR